VLKLFGKSLVSRFERIPIRRDFEKRISGDSYVAINPSPIVELDDRLTGNELALWIVKSTQ
jgi:hypothetical protein